MKESNHMQPQELARRIASREAPAVVDVRTGFEFRDGHIPGAIHAPVWKILLRLVSLPSDKGTEMVVLCELGPRAMAGKLVLLFFGFRNVSLLNGHMAGWRRLDLPMEREG